jgi:hypothetical protein
MVAFKRHMMGKDYCLKSAISDTTGKRAIFGVLKEINHCLETTFRTTFPEYHEEFDQTLVQIVEEHSRSKERKKKARNAKKEKQLKEYDKKLEEMVMEELSAQEIVIKKEKESRSLASTMGIAKVPISDSDTDSE